MGSNLLTSSVPPFSFVLVVGQALSQVTLLFALFFPVSLADIPLVFTRVQAVYQEEVDSSVDTNEKIIQADKIIIHSKYDAKDNNHNDIGKLTS